MAMRLVVLLLATLLTIAPLAQADPPDSDPLAVEEWFQRVVNTKPTLARIHFFIHDITNVTTIPIAKADITDKSNTSFGLVDVIDSPLTVGPRNDSQLLGYCQGTFTLASREELGVLLTLNFVFTSGTYNGSTLSILGRKLRSSTYREYAVVGGSGAFRLAQGVTVDWTYQDPIPSPGPPAPVEALVWVLHYEIDPSLEMI